MAGSYLGPLGHSQIALAVALAGGIGMWLIARLRKGRGKSQALAGRPIA